VSSMAIGVASNFAPRIGVRPIAVAGMVLTILGLLLFSRVPVDGSYAADVLIDGETIVDGGDLLL